MELRIVKGARFTLCKALLVRGRQSFPGRAAVLSSTLENESDKVKYMNRIVKLAFYRAALNSGLPKPEWGCLSGVRPVKLMDEYLRGG